MTDTLVRPRRHASFAEATVRVLDLSLGQMLWSKRMLFTLLVVGAPFALALAARVLHAAGLTVLRVNGASVGGSTLFGVMMWILFVRFIVPILGVSYGTGLIADEVEDRTITYLFTRPIPRGAILFGKYVSYLLCTAIAVLPTVLVMYFILTPAAAISSTFGFVMKDLGILVLGLASYGAFFALIGSIIHRPLVTGLVLALGWEPVVMLLPGYLKRATIAYYLQALVPHAMPAEPSGTFLQSVFRDSPSPAAAVAWLCAVLVFSLVLGVRAVGRREYVLDQ